MRKLFTTLLQYAIIDVLFPQTCVLCGKLVSDDLPGVCNICFNSLNQHVKNYDSRVVYESEDKIHGKRQWFIDDGIWVFDYNSTIAQLMFSLKYKKNKCIAGLFSSYCIEPLRRKNWEIDIITYVPMQKRREWERGYNQGCVIAQQIAADLQVEVADLFDVNKKNTQKFLSGVERFTSSFEKYRIKSRVDVYNKNLLIVDDVYTTGATINECARVLKSNGANKVFACVVAYAAVKELI